MRPFLVFFMCLMAFSETNSQVSLPYYSGFDSAAERIGWKQFRMGQDDTFDFNFNGFDALSEPNSLYHDYPVGGISLTNDWFVSPELALPSGGSIDSIWFNTSGFGTPQVGDTIAIFALYGNKDPELATSKILLASITDSSYSKQPGWEYYTNIQIPASSEPCFIGINYQTVNNWLTIRIDNIYISEANTTNLSALNESGLTLYPNPASEMLYINKEQDEIREVVLYDYRGLLMFQFFQVGNSLDISSLERGLYYILIVTDKEQKTFKILKQ